MPVFILTVVAVAAVTALFFIRVTERFKLCDRSLIIGVSALNVCFCVAFPLIFALLSGKTADGLPAVGFWTVFLIMTVLLLLYVCAVARRVVLRSPSLNLNIALPEPYEAIGTPEETEAAGDESGGEAGGGTGAAVGAENGAAKISAPDVGDEAGDGAETAAAETALELEYEAAAESAVECAAPSAAEDGSGGETETAATGWQELGAAMDAKTVETADGIADGAEDKAILTSDNADIDSATHGIDTTMPHCGIVANANAREYKDIGADMETVADGGTDGAAIDASGDEPNDGADDIIKENFIDSILNLDKMGVAAQDEPRDPEEAVEPATLDLDGLVGAAFDSLNGGRLWEAAGYLRRAIDSRPPLDMEITIATQLCGLYCELGRADIALDILTDYRDRYRGRVSGDDLASIEAAIRDIGSGGRNHWRESM